MPQQRPYQVAGTEFLRSTGRAILADEAGVGKTNQLLLAAKGRTLVMSPAALRDVWLDEIEAWEPPDAEFHWVSYTGVCKRVPEKPGKPASIVIPALRDTIPKRWDTVICDEAHYLKNKSGNWAKVVAKLKSEQFFLATGTPLPNWSHEIFMLLRLLYPGDKRFSNYQRWLGEYFRVWNPPWGGKHHVEVRGLHRGLTWEEVAQEWGLEARWLRRILDDVLPDLPPMTTQVINVEMRPKQAAVYKRLQTEWLAILPDTGNEVVSWNDGGIYQKLLQCSTGLSTLDPGETVSCKLDAVRDLMVERQHPTILFCIYKNTAEALVKLMDKLGRSVGVVSSAYSVDVRRTTVKKFKDGEYDVLVGTLGTLSEGFTLTRADTCIFVEHSPRPVTNVQARRRIRRFGQERPTLAIELVTADTVNEDLLRLLADKTEDIDAAITGFQLAAMG